MPIVYDPNDSRIKRGGPDETPSPQHDTYLALSEAERAKGFVRPVRRSYTHAGERPKHPLRDLTDEEQAQLAGEGYVKFEVYPPLPAGSPGGATGRFWTQKALTSGCGTVTTMGIELAETYAREPKFYGNTYCVGCQMHRPVAEFVWDKTNEVVGS